MSVETKTQFEIGATVKAAAVGLGVIQRLIGEDRALVKFIAPTAEGDSEDIVLIEDLQLVEQIKAQVSEAKSVSQKVDPISVLTKYGIPGTPLRGKAPFLQGWQNSASKDAAQLETWKQIPGVTGFGGVAKAEIGGFWAL